MKNVKVLGSGMLMICSRGKGLNTGAEFCVCRSANDKVLVKSDGLNVVGKFGGIIKKSALNVRR
jgi:hypothetical protein